MKKRPYQTDEVIKTNTDKKLYETVKKDKTYRKG